MNCIYYPRFDLPWWWARFVERLLARTAIGHTAQAYATIFYHLHLPAAAHAAMMRDRASIQPGT